MEPIVQTGSQVWQGGTVLIVVEDPILARQVNTRNYARPRFLLPFAGEQQDAANHSCAPMTIEGQGSDVWY